MSEQATGAVLDTDAQQSLQVTSMFKARIGRFDDRAEQKVMDELAAWVEDTYREELSKRPSKHVYVRNLSPAIAARIDCLRDAEVVTSAILE